MDFVELPSIALVLANLDHEDFYNRLHARGSIFLLSNPRRWLVVGYREVEKLLNASGLSSRRLDTIERLNKAFESDEFVTFFDQWLMYTDGIEHANRRRNYTWRLNRLRSNLGLWNEIKRTARKACMDLEVDLTKDIQKDIFKPFVIASLATVLGVEQYRVTEGYTLINPILRILHGRGEKLEGNTSGSVAESLNTWPNYLASLRDELVKNDSDLSDEDLTLDTVGELVVPFLDVVDVLSSLCGSLFLSLLTEQIPVETITTRDSVSEIVRLNAPFQVCNRTVSDVTAEFREFRTGDSVSLVIGAANRDPRVFINPSTVVSNRAVRSLSFGLGPHLCSGKELSIRILESLYNELIYFMPEWKSSILGHKAEYIGGWAYKELHSLKLSTRE